MNLVELWRVGDKIWHVFLKRSLPQLYEYTKQLFKGAHFMVCELYLNNAITKTNPSWVHKGKYAQSSWWDWAQRSKCILGYLVMTKEERSFAYYCNKMEKNWSLHNQSNLLIKFQRIQMLMIKRCYIICKIRWAKLEWGLVIHVKPRQPSFLHIYRRELIGPNNKKRKEQLPLNWPSLILFASGNCEQKMNCFIKRSLP